MSSYFPTVLSPEQRAALADDPAVGGGNLLPSAIAANPHPELAFIHSYLPLTNLDGEPQRDFSLLQLDELAQSWSSWYLDQGVRPRDRVAVWLPDSFAYSLHFWSLAQIGAIAVLVNSRAPEAIARSLIEQSTAVGLYTDQQRLATLRDAGGLPESLRWTRSLEELPAPPRAELPDRARFRHAPEDPVTLLHSSGTTGTPKPTIHTHESIVAGPKFRLTALKEVPGSLMMTALPQSHLGCVAFSAFAVLGGTPLVALRDSAAPELVTAVREHRPTSVMSFAHSYAELAAHESEPGALDSVDLWVSIGDAVHHAHMTRILSRRSEGLPAATFYDRLGTTELGWGVLLKVVTPESERNDRCAGRPVGVAEVAVLQADGTPAPVGEVGLLAARGPAITPGYWNASDLTYQHRLAGYWLTGDLAYRNADGDHYLVDRAVDAIETEAGTGYSVLMEEIILSEVPEVVDVAVVAGRRGDRVLPVAVVTTQGADAAPEKLLTRANEALRATGHPALHLLEVARSERDFPVGVTGKVLKRQLRETYSDLTRYDRDPAGRTFAIVDRA